jgi:hypothetical protein
MLLRRADEAGMVADVDKAAARPEDAPRLRDRGAEVVEVGVRERRVSGVEGARREGQHRCVRVYERRIRVALACDADLIGRVVDADDGPAQIAGDADEVVAATAQVEASSAAGAEEPPERSGGGRIVGRARVDERVVHIGEAVVLRAVHPCDASLGGPGCPVRG